MKSSNTWLAVWGVVVEVLVTGALYTLAVSLFDNRKLYDLILAASSVLTTIAGILAAASFAFWITFLFYLMQSDFGQYLAFKRVSQIYLAAFGVPILIYVGAVLTFGLAQTYKTERMAQLSLLVALYGAVNLITIVTNGIKLVGFHGAFKRELRRTDCEAQRSQTA